MSAVIVGKGGKEANQRWFVKKKKWLPTMRDGDILKSEQGIDGDGSDGYTCKRTAAKAVCRWKRESYEADLTRSAVGWEIRYCVELGPFPPEP